MSTRKSYRVMRWDKECRQQVLVDVDGATRHSMILFFLDAVRINPNKVDFFVKMLSRPTAHNKKGWLSDNEFTSFVMKVAKAVKSCNNDASKVREKLDEFRRQLL